MTRGQKNLLARGSAVVLAFLMIFLTAAPVFAQTNFRDVPATHFAFEAINWVSDPANGAFMVGDAANNFNPSRNVNKFEAAQVFAMAAGFRPAMSLLPPAEREVFTRSMDMHRDFLTAMATEFSSWNRTVDREIAFLLYRGIVTPDEVRGFVTRIGQTEQRAMLSRQQAVAWMVRLVGQSAHAQAVVLPHHTPFRDDAAISQNLRRYVYHALELGIIGGAGGYLNPAAQFTRAEMATMFHNALADEPAAQIAGTPATITGTIANVHQNTHVSITAASGTDTFEFAQNSFVMIDNVQRSVADLRVGMQTTALTNANRQVISILARSVADTAADGNAFPLSDEGFVTAVSTTPQTVTIRTQRVRISGQIIDEERTFTFANNAAITRGGVAANFSDITVGDVAFFNATGNVLNAIDLMERERTILGILTEMRLPETPGASPVLIIEETDGASYELRVQTATVFSRGAATNLNWYDLRIGDAITAEAELDRLVRVHAVGERSVVDGRLTEIRITEALSEITITREDDTSSVFTIRAGVFDVYTLRIGSNLRVNLDSREVTSIQVLAAGAAQPTVIQGFIQSIRADNTIVIVEGQGANARTHTLSVPANTTITRGTSNINFADLRVNMNVHIVLTAPGSGNTRTITVLP